MGDIGPIHLTLLMGRQIVAPTPQPVTDALLSAQVTVTAGQRSGFQLAFDLTKNGIIQQALLPAGAFEPVPGGLRNVVGALPGLQDARRIVVVGPAREGHQGTDHPGEACNAFHVENPCKDTSFAR